MLPIWLYNTSKWREYILFGPGERERLVGELAATLASGGRYYLPGFAIDSPDVLTSSWRDL